MAISYYFFFMHIVFDKGVKYNIIFIIKYIKQEKVGYPC